MKYKVIAIGVSWGGMKALQVLLPKLPKSFSIPIIIVQHLGAYSGTEWITILDRMSKVKVKEADEKEKIVSGVYIAPANYHLLIEKDKTFSLSLDERVNHARPSIDVLFDCVADVYGAGAIGVILTGLNNDGAQGLKQIQENGGTVIVQNPDTAETSEMPLAALRATTPNYVVHIEELIPLLIKLEKE
jgi:two-component system chemotaxis response regulator CheB